MKLTWRDSEEIAWALIDAHPEIDPLRLSFPKLRQMVLGIAEFEDNPEGSSEATLEAIQMAWYEETK